MKKKIQRIELGAYDIPYFCPFCGHKVFDSNPDASEPISPCPHTLFVANDEGFDHRSAALDENLGIKGVVEDDIELPEKGLDGLTDQITIPNSIKFAIYVPPPGFLGLYIGFAPEVE